jgi:hypothetical protein
LTQNFQRGDIWMANPVMTKKVTVDYYYGNRPAGTIETKDYIRMELQNLRTQLAQRENNDVEWIYKIMGKW